MTEEYTEADREFREVQDRMFEVFRAKNRDYGNHFLKYTKLGAYMDLLRKWNRIETIFENGVVKVQDESLEDTLLDLANYCILTVILLRKQKG